MKQGMRYALAAAVALTAATAGHLTARALAPESPPQDAAPNHPGQKEALATLLALTLPDSAGSPQALAQWRGKTLVLNFWATWCPPCRDEIPDFAAASRRLAGEPVQFIGLSMDSAENVRAFTQDVDVPYPLLIASSDVLGLAAAFGNPSRALPFTLIIGPGGDVRHTRLGPLNAVELEGKIRPLLASRDTADTTPR